MLSIKKSKNKKGIIFDIAQFLWDFGLVTVVFICLSVVIFAYINEEFYTDDLEISLLYSKLINTPDCLAKTDTQLLTSPTQGLIDIKRFNKNSLINCRIAEGASLKLSLISLKDIEISPEIRIGNEKALNLLNVCDAAKNFKCFKKMSLIQYSDNNQIKPAILRMEVIKNA